MSHQELDYFKGVVGGSKMQRRVVEKRGSTLQGIGSAIRFGAMIGINSGGKQNLGNFQESRFAFGRVIDLQAQCVKGRHAGARVSERNIRSQIKLHPQTLRIGIPDRKEDGGTPTIGPEIDVPSMFNQAFRESEVAYIAQRPTVTSFDVRIRKGRRFPKKMRML